MRSDNHINVGRMTEFSYVTWACKYALVVGSLAIERVRVIYLLPISVLVGHSHRQASSCFLLDMRHPIGVASRRSSLSHPLPVPRLLGQFDMRVSSSLSGSLKHVLPHRGFLPPSKVTGHANRSFTASNPNLDPYRLYWFTLRRPIKP